MQRALLAGGLGLAAIVLAIVLFQAPDTGGEVAPAADRTPVSVAHPTKMDDAAPMTVPGSADADELAVDGAERPALPSDGLPTPPDIVPEEGEEVVRRGPNPINAALDARRQEPDAIYAGKFTGSWTMIRRDLAAMNDPEATAFAEKAADVVRDFRDFRRHPIGATGYDDIVAEQRALIQELRSSRFATGAIGTQLSQLGTLDSELALIRGQ